MPRAKACGTSNRSFEAACGSIANTDGNGSEPISKLAAQPDYFVVSSLAPRCTSMYYLGARCGPSRTRAARPILRYVCEIRSNQNGTSRCADLAAAEHDPFAARQTLQPDRPARGELVRRNADFCTEPVFVAVGESRRRIDHHRARVDLAQKTHRVAVMLGDDRIGVLRT